MVFPAFCVFDQSSESINKQKPIGQARKRVSHLSFSNIGLRSCHPRGFSRGVTNSESPAQHPTKGSILVQHTLLALEMRRQSFSMGSEFVFDTFSIRIMYAVKPFFQFVPDFAFVVAQHGFPARREIHDVGQQIPVPEAVVGASSRQRIAFFTLSQSLVRSLE